MTTKSCCYSISKNGEEQQSFGSSLTSNQDSQYKNLNLNPSHFACDKDQEIQSKSISSFDKRIHNKNDIICNNLQNGSTFKNKCDKLSHPFSTESLNIHGSQKEEENEKNSSANNSNSTLSLHIAAYENSSAETSNNQNDALKRSEKHAFEKSWKGVKQISSSKTKGKFETPRQQSDESTNEPEVMQFKASQNLLNPNQENLSPNSSAEKIPPESTFENLKDEANMLFKARKYKDAIKIYNKILQLPSLTSAKKAVIYSNKSAANLLLNDGKNSLEEAKNDANESIKFHPTWWKGYYRLGKVQVELKEWHEAEKTLEKALALNSSSYEIRDELSNVRAQIGIFSRQDHLNPSFRPPSVEEQMAETCSRLGIGESQVDNLLKEACEYRDLFQGNAFRDGNGVKKDLVKAAEFYAKSAAKGNADAMYNLGKMYNYGEGVKRDYEKSLYWLLKAANSESLIMPGSGIPEAQHAIGLKYFEGTGVEKDYQKAAEWYDKAAKNGSGRSANNLGLLYKDGLGVEKSEAKAFKYFEYAVQQSDDSAAMVNLADCYFNGVGTNNDHAKGMKWLQMAADKGDLRVESLLKLRKIVGFDENQFKFFDENQNAPFNYSQYGKYVKEAAENGSKTAQRHMEIWKNMSDSMKAYKEKDPAQLVAALSKAIRLASDLVVFPKFFEQMIIKRFKAHPNELDAVICYARIDPKNPAKGEFAQKYNKMFPEEIFLWETVIATYMFFEQNVGAAFETIEMVLKRFPRSPLTMYIYAILLLRINSSQCIQAFDAYLAAVPEDNEKVPAAHYQKSQYYTTVFDIPNAYASLKAGEAAESKQLPCFLPYEKNGFSLMKPMLDMFCASYKPPLSSPQALPSSNLRLEQIKNDPLRKIFTLNNREHFISRAKIYVMLRKSSSETVQNVPHKPAPPNWPLTKTKKITGRDMDPTKDKVYNGCLLNGRIIDWAFLMSSIATNIEDENGQIHRFVINKWPLPSLRDFAILEAVKVFRPNVKTSIINPYHRKARDGYNTIRVEGPEYVKLDTSMIDEQCHVCGKEGKALPSCSQCKMALYCSKECQTFDWTEFNHKGICKYLKMFSQLI